MRKKIACLFIISCFVIGAAELDVKTYERSLKSVLPWSLRGSAADLRSDAKHQLQLLLRSFIYLRPDAPLQEDGLPSVASVERCFSLLQQHLDSTKSKAKQQWVIDSLDYIVNSYAPEVKSMLEQAQADAANPEAAAFLSKKEQLFPLLLDRVVQARNALQAKVY